MQSLKIPCISLSAIERVDEVMKKTIFRGDLKKKIRAPKKCCIFEKNDNDGRICRKIYQSIYRLWI